MSNMLFKAFRQLWTGDMNINNEARVIDIKYFSDQINEQFPENRQVHCAVAIVRHIFSMLTVEHVPKELINKLCSFERLNQDVIGY